MVRTSIEIIELIYKELTRFSTLSLFGQVNIIPLRILIFITLSVLFLIL
jgi:hypothetical protein